MIKINKDYLKVILTKHFILYKLSTQGTQQRD